MSMHPIQPTIEDEVQTLFESWTDAWNRRSAAEMASLVAPCGHVIGFDGSEMHGAAEVEAQLGAIFREHETASYVAKVREVRLLSRGVALLRAMVGMLPPGSHELNPEVNAIQTLVAVLYEDRWLIESMQNTPAALHGRPEAREALTAELGALVGA